MNGTLEESFTVIKVLLNDDTRKSPTKQSIGSKNQKVILVVVLSTKPFRHESTTNPDSDYMWETTHRKVSDMLYKV